MTKDSTNDDYDIEKSIQDLTDPKPKQGKPSEYNFTSFPTSMSCSQAFEELVQCYSVGGQFRNVYRYGEMNACRDKRAKLKFCVMVKLQDEEEQKVRIAQYYKEQLAKKRVGGSSEDIWTRREHPLNSPFLEE